VSRTSSSIPPAPKILSLPGGASWLEIPEEEFARQLTLLDFAAFRSIKLSEFFDRNWIKPDKARLSPNVNLMIERFNRLCDWVPSSIVMTPKLKERTRIYSRLIRIAAQLRELRNFNGLMAFMLGLRSGSVSRLKFTHDELPRKFAKERRKLSELEDEMGFTEDKVTQKYKELFRISPSPCIPYVSTILKDLVVVENEHNEISPGLLNFRKRRDIFNILSMLDQYTTCDYPLIEVPDVQNLIQNLQPLDPKQSFALSLQIEPKNAKKGDIK